MIYHGTNAFSKKTVAHKNEGFGHCANYEKLSKGNPSVLKKKKKTECAYVCSTDGKLEVEVTLSI